VRAAFVKHAELVFRLETGRTHQIRVHLAGAGHPLLNDPLYGRKDPRVELPGQALHAWRLEFVHPRTGDLMEFESSPPPAYLRARALVSS
jgi:23S rRNA pseudouridine1911/1915/1917 synthase